jgi:hypothetical protein
VSRGFRVGERVRVVNSSRDPFDGAGQVGTVVCASRRWPTDEVAFYFIRLEGRDGRLGLFYAEEVEALDSTRGG